MTHPYSKDAAYCRTAWQAKNLEQFDEIIAAHNIKDALFFPNIQGAPWHVQAFINGAEINFWPHKMKAYSAGYGSQEGWRAVSAMIEKILHDEPVELFE